MVKASRYNDPLPRNLRHLLEERKLSQQAVADALGVKRQSVAQYCDGSACPSLQRLCSLADFFGVTTDYLLGRTECKSPDVEVQAACERYGLSESALHKLEDMNLNGLAHFNKLIDFLIDDLTTPVAKWYNALVEIKALEKTKKISLYSSRKYKINDDGTMCITLQEAKYLYVQMIASYIQEILISNEQP